MNYLDLMHDLGNASQDDYSREAHERAVFVVDEEGFVHVPVKVYWDPEAGCFWIRTEFKNKNGAQF